MHDVAIVLLTRYPHNVWLNFLNNFYNYDVYICIDNTKKDFSKLFEQVNSKLTFIQMDDNYCKSYGYHNALIPTGSVPNKPVSWDKALFYFCLIKDKYKHVWFIEDDVFFLKESVLKNLDIRFPTSDLLAPFNDINYDGNVNSGWQWWVKVSGKMNTPWARSMVCACRLSNRLLNLVKEYVKKNNTLVYHEIMFNTLAFQNNYIIDTPIELNTIHYNTKWNKDQLNLEYLYHPIKDIQVHSKLRYDNWIHFDHLFNRVNYNYLEKFTFDAGSFLLKHYPLPEGFNFNCYRQNNNCKDWWDESVAWHWFNYGQYEGRKYKD
jgi:hypothetical protein